MHRRVDYHRNWRWYSAHGTRQNYSSTPGAEVVYFEAFDKYVNVVTQNGAALIRIGLKELLPQLDGQQFWQIPCGTIVHASCVASALRDESGRITLQLRIRPEQLRVSPLYAHLFRQM
jgi:DNA-binding LytR/AlgR family response regulator